MYYFGVFESFIVMLKFSCYRSQDHIRNKYMLLPSNSRSFAVSPLHAIRCKQTQLTLLWE